MDYHLLQVPDQCVMAMWACRPSSPKAWQTKQSIGKSGLSQAVRIQEPSEYVTTVLGEVVKRSLPVTYAYYGISLDEESNGFNSCEFHSRFLHLWHTTISLHSALD
ncbi:uncharacterized protein [Cherax quadricarinatus]|uniref:uncharacterized protein n=1 Tax=Cherax quadricarinatus TaxID=27406 RepID=UPI00387ECF81